MDKKLCKSKNNIKLDGVCAGFADYFGIDVTVVRLLWIASHFVGIPGFIIYIVCSVVMPRETDIIDYTNQNHN